MATNSKYWALKRQPEAVPGRSSSSGGSGDSAVSVTPCERKPCRPNDTQFMSLYYSLAPVVVNTEKTFHVLAQDPSRLGAVRIQVTDPTGVRVEALIEQTPSGFKVQFTPSELGDYSIEILLGDVPLTESPLRLRSVSPGILPPGTAPHSSASSQSLLEPGPMPIASATLPSTSRQNRGAENPAYLFSPPDATMPTRSQSVRGRAQSDRQRPRPSSHPNDFDAETTTHHGNPHQGLKSEYVSADPQNMPPLPHKVRAYGDGLSSGRARDPAVFLIDTRGAGRGNIDLTIEGPSEARVHCYDNGDGTCTCTYFPALEGPYRIAIQYAGTHIPGSPFAALVAPPHPPSPPPAALMNSVDETDFMLIETAPPPPKHCACSNVSSFK